MIHRSKEAKESLNQYLQTTQGKEDHHWIRTHLSDTANVRADLFRRFGLDMETSEPTRKDHAIQAVLFADSLEKADKEALPGAKPLEWIEKLYENCFRRAGAQTIPSLAIVAFGQNEGHLPDDELIANHKLTGLSQKFAEELFEKQQLPAIYHQAALAASRETEEHYHALRLGLLCDTYHELFAQGITPKPDELAGDKKDVEEVANRFISLLNPDEAERLATLALTPTWDVEALAACFFLNPQDHAGIKARSKRILGFSFVQPVGDGVYTLHSVMRSCLLTRLTPEEKKQLHEFWREHWQSRAITDVDDFASRAWNHWYAADRETAMEWWNRDTGGARERGDGIRHGALCLFPPDVPAVVLDHFSVAGDLVSWSFELVECQVGDTTQLMAKAKSMAIAATEIATRDLDSQGWARAQGNLGNVLWTLGERTNDPAMLEQAVEAYRLALEVYTKETLPADWAMTQNNLGNVFGTLGERTNDPAMLERAVEAYRLALEVYTKETLPASWAATQNNLGLVLRTLGERTNDPAMLEQAVEAYRLALEVYTKETLPADWAMTQNNLGIVLRTLGERTNDPAMLEQAIEAYRLALEVRTKETLPADWAMTQNNLGIVLGTLGERTNDPAMLERAVKAYRLALEVYTKETLPASWAATQNNLGTALKSHGCLTSDAKKIVQAYEAFESAASVLLEIPAYAPIISRNLARCKAILDAIQAGKPPEEWPCG
jgi:tetratricopeptide (TPR) repeat protein